MQYKNEFGMSCTYRIEANYKKKIILFYLQYIYRFLLIIFFFFFGQKNISMDVVYIRIIVF